MRTDLATLRRLTVVIALSGIAAVGTVALAPAALADETAVVQPTPVVEPAAVVDSVPLTVPAPVVEVPAPVAPAPSAPVAQTAPVPQSDDDDDDDDDDAPIVTAPPPVVVVDKDGNEHKAPQYCTVAELDAVAAKVAAATKQAVLLNRLASAARDAASLLRAKATTLNKPKAAAALDLARLLEASADKLAAQAQKLVDEAAKKKCEVAPVSGGRF